MAERTRRPSRWRPGHRDGAAARARSRVRRSTRRSVHRPRPLARAQHRRPAARGWSAPRSGAGPVQGRPDELGHAGIEDDAPPLSVARVEDAGKQPAGAATMARPGSTARRGGRSPASSESASRRRREVGRVGEPASRTGMPDPMSSVSKSSSRARCRRSGRGRSERRSARRRPRRAATRRARATRASAAGRPGRRRPR